MSVKSTESDQQTGISARIRALADDNKLTIKELALRVGAKPRTVQNYVLGERTVGTDFLSMLTAQMGISASWVLTGIGPILLSDTQMNAESDPEIVRIPKFTVSASAGNGVENTSEDASGQLAFDRRWLRQRGLKSDRLAIITVSGDSMEPKLRNQDLILVDLDQRTASDGKTYVLRIGDELLVKHIQRVSQRAIDLISANPTYPPRTVDLTKERDNIQIIGKVVASMQDW
tara:strand:- start:626 stop:1318 length:693 start_codon:yes stop_codon:yes gene_type:complete